MAAVEVDGAVVVAEASVALVAAASVVVVQVAAGDRTTLMVTRRTHLPIMAHLCGLHPHTHLS
jgi:hypothetical protein